MRREGFQKSQCWPEFPSIQNSAPAPAESPMRRGRFSEITILHQIPLHSEPLPGLASAASPVWWERFSEITILAQIPLPRYIQNPWPPRHWRQAPCGGEGFPKSQYWPKLPSIQNPCLARRWRQAPCGGEGFQKSQYWPKLCLSPVIKVRDTREGSQAKYERNVKGSRGNQLLNLGWRQGGGRV